MFRIYVFIVLLIALATLLNGCTNGQKEEPKAQPAAATVSPAMRAADPVYGYVDAARADLSDGKVQVINQVMRLTPEEAKVFWPIYHDYEDELFTLGDQRVELTKNYVNSLSLGELDNDRAAKLSEGWFTFETKRLELLQKYHKQIAEQLSPIRAAQFTQIEHRMGTVIDVVIASELPLMRGAPVKAKAQ